jgi:hypothetical protein
VRPTLACFCDEFAEAAEKALEVSRALRRSNWPATDRAARELLELAERARHPAMTWCRDLVGAIGTVRDTTIHVDERTHAVWRVKVRVVLARAPERVDELAPPPASRAARS